jgi:NodT family efflux transporter outer membrane factor (OMF) lipoprotein
LAGCATKAPPELADIREQAGVIADLQPTSDWVEAAAVGPIADNWLASFNDDQLDALVAEAMAKNPDLRVASTKVEQASQYVELSKAALRPSLSILGIGGFNLGGGDIGSPLQGGSLRASWEPDLWGRMRYGQYATEASHASIQADFEFARQSLAAMVARGWFAAGETWQQRRIADEMVSAAEKLLELAEKRHEIGAGNEQDVALSRANLGNYRDNARQVQLAHQQAQRSLELLIGRYPSAELSVRADFVALPPDIPAGLPLQMLERRPDMVAAERRVAAAFNRVGEAKAARLPRIILNANASYISSEILELQPDYENPSFGAGATLIAPIYEGGALKTQATLRTLEQEEAVANYARQALQALGDVESTLAAGRALADRKTILNRVLAESERALAMAETAYRVGSGDLRAVQQQLLGVQTARLALLRIQSEQLSQRVNLHLVLGGSFEPVTSVQAAAAPAQADGAVQ